MDNDTTKEFHIGDVLSITHSRLVSPRLIGGVYDILNFMTGENLFTHQLPRAGKVCGPALLDQHPQLKEINESQVTSDNWREWLDEQITKYGETLMVTKLKVGEYEGKDPLTELEEMAPGKPIIAVQV